MIEDQGYLKRARAWIEHFNWLADRQQGYHQKIEQDWRRWHADPSLALELRQGTTNTNVGRRRPDQRVKDWQTVLVEPRGAINSFARNDMMANLLAETDPFLRVRGWQLEDLREERPIEALLNHQIAVLNPPIRWTGELFRDAFVQGCAPLEARWVERWDTIDMPARPHEIKRFRVALQAALRVVDEARASGDSQAMDPPGIREDGSFDWSLWGGPRQQELLAAWDAWAAGVQARYQITIPPPPFPRRERVAAHVGIELAVLSKLDLYWDFRVPRFQDVPVIYKVMVLNRTALLKGAAAENKRRQEAGMQPAFDLDAIRDLPAGLNATLGGRARHYSSVSALHAAAMEVLGYGDDSSDPRHADDVEILEVHEPGAADEHRFCWIGQRDRPLTLPGYAPWSIPRHPFMLHQHIPFAAIGHSAYDYDGPRHELADRMLSRAADLHALVSGSPMIREGAVGLEGRTELEPAPFSMIDAPWGVTYRALYDANMAPALEAAMAGYQLALQGIDESHGISEVQRGAAAQLNRVSAQEVTTRADAAQGRPKNELLRFAAMVQCELAPLVSMMCWELGDPEQLKNIMGSEAALEAMTAEAMRPAFQQNYLTLVAVLEADRALKVQQFQETLKVGAELQAIIPGKASARIAFQEQLRLSRSPIAVALAQASARDAEEADQAAQAIQQLQQQVAELQQQVQQSAQERKLMLAENTSLRSALALPPYDTLEMIVEQLRAGQVTPGAAAEQPALQQQLPPGEEPQEALDDGPPQA